MLCECGCGKDAGVYVGINKRGQPKRVINGHQLRLAASQQRLDTDERRRNNANRTHCFRGHNLSEVGMIGIKKKTCARCALEWIRKYKYGVTPEQVQAMRTQQNNKCLICGDMFTGTPHVDHSHTTQQVRGLLCYSCNTLLGMAHDIPVVLENAAQYLRETTQKCQKEKSIAYEWKVLPIPMDLEKSLQNTSLYSQMVTMA